MDDFNAEHDQNHSDNDLVRERYFNLLNESADFLSPGQSDYLLDLIKKGEIKEFNKLYWGILSQRKSKNKTNDLFNSNNKGSEYFNNSIEENLILREQIDQLREKVNKAETSLVRNEALAKNFERSILEKDSLLEQYKIKIAQLESSNNELSSRVQQERIDQKIPGYVESVKDDLSSDDDHFILMSQIWAGVGVLFGILAVVFSFISMYITIDFKISKGFELFYLFTRGLIGISLLSWLSYICLSNSKKYTHESIRRKDRRHALMFGQVFLQIYGSTATKEDAVLVFKDWNMSGDSAFSDQTEHPPSIQSLWDAAKEKIKPSTEKSTS
ncbi:hypothetical protein ACV8TC_18235 [Citrobacter freundii]